MISKLLHLTQLKRHHARFFTSPYAKANAKKKVLTAGIIFSIAAGTLFVLLSLNPNISGTAGNLFHSRNQIQSLADIQASATFKLIRPQLGSLITKNLISLDIPFGKKSGFCIEFNEKKDLTHAKIIIFVEKPACDVALDVVVKDTSFFSNGEAPITATITASENEFTQVEIPIAVDPGSRCDLRRISQIRLLFSQKTRSFVSVVIPNIILANDEN